MEFLGKELFGPVGADPMVYALIFPFWIFHMDFLLISTVQMFREQNYFTLQEWFPLNTSEKTPWQQHNSYLVPAIVPSW